MIVEKNLNENKFFGVDVLSLFEEAGPIHHITIYSRIVANAPQSARGISRK